MSTKTGAVSILFLTREQYISKPTGGDLGLFVTL